MTNSFRCRSKLLIPFLLATLTSLSHAATAVETVGDLFTPDGYRRDQIHTPTPPDVPGGKTISATDLKAMMDRHAPLGLIDVGTTPPRPKELPADTLWLQPRHDNIPGSLWLPDTGQSALSDALERYFRSGLDRATGGDKSVPVAIYCRNDCWWSWNAAKRAALWGYNVLWFPGGVEGWAAAGFPLVEAHPEPSAELGR